MSPPSGEQPIPRGPQSHVQKTATNIILVQGGVEAPQSGFLDGVGGSGWRRLASRSPKWSSCCSVRRDPSDAVLGECVDVPVAVYVGCSTEPARFPEQGGRDVGIVRFLDKDVDKRVVFNVVELIVVFSTTDHGRTWR